MLLPVMAIYAENLSGTTPILLGLALGIYGLTQAIFQIPFGMLSDRIDRKLAITIGLIVFALGSAVSALSESIYWLIIGRGIQGAGAISAAILALNSDLTRANQRTKAMAMIGISIGFTFLLSLILAPMLQGIIGVNGLFWMISTLALIAIWVLHKVVPDVPAAVETSSKAQDGFRTALTNPQLLQLDLGIFTIHLVLTALFIVLPGLLVEKSGMELSQHWKIYTPILLISVAGMAPFVIAGSMPRWVTLAYRLGAILMLASLILLLTGVNNSLTWLLVSVILFFSAFNALESLLPSLVSQIAMESAKGTAMGIYNTFQFSGIFVGGLGGGLAYDQFGLAGVFGFCCIAVGLWLVVVLISANFKLTVTKTIQIGELSDSRRSELIDRIGQIQGVENISIVNGETVAYLAVDEAVYNDADIEQLIKT